jgi:hypothetical protein
MRGFAGDRKSIQKLDFFLLVLIHLLSHYYDGTDGRNFLKHSYACIFEPNVTVLQQLGRIHVR